MLSPLNTQKILLEKLEVVLEPNYTESRTEDYSVDVKIDIKKKSDAPAFRIALGVTMLPSDGAVCRYSASVSIHCGYVRASSRYV